MEECVRSIKNCIDLLGGIGKFVRPGSRVLLKPNFIAPARPERAVTTDPRFILAVAEVVKNAKPSKISIGDSPGFGSAARVINRIFQKGQLKESGIDVVELQTSYRPEKVSHTDGTTFRHIEIAKEIEQFDVIINLPKVKTHVQTVLTLAVKNLFGCVVGMRKKQWHLKSGIDEERFARFLLDLSNVIAPSLTIVDGIVGMDGNGPQWGRARELNFIIASSSCIAVDRVVAELLCYDVTKVPTLKVAERDMARGSRIEQIMILGECLERLKVSDFNPARGISTESWIIPSRISPLIKNALTPKPKIKRQVCELCGICVSHCPSEVILIFDKKGKRVELDKNLKKGHHFAEINHRKCIRCFCCYELCPSGAVEIVDGWMLRGLSFLKR